VNQTNQPNHAETMKILLQLLRAGLLSLAALSAEAEEADDLFTDAVRHLATASFERETTTEVTATLKMAGQNPMKMPASRESSVVHRHSDDQRPVIYKRKASGSADWFAVRLADRLALRKSTNPWTVPDGADAELVRRMTEVAATHAPSLRRTPNRARNSDMTWRPSRCRSKPRRCWPNSIHPRHHIYDTRSPETVRARQFSRAPAVAGHRRRL
jgi:hypothetical protein